MKLRQPTAVAASLAVSAVCSGVVFAQQDDQQQEQRRRSVQVSVPLGSEEDQQRERERQAALEQRRKPPGPVPRTADGRVILGGKGLWTPGAVVGNPLGLKDIPYQPWARALATERRRQQLEPHTRCKPSGVARVFLTPYGVEIVEAPEFRRIYIFDVGGPHTYRTIYMDGRTHPPSRTPDYYGHSIGWWEGDTLVVETTGFNEDFWLDRGQLPHTAQMRTLERFTRLDSDTMRYELTIHDPGAYTAPVSGQMLLRWEDGTELFEFVCQQANYAHHLMVGQGTSVDRSSLIVP